ncbi:hypothetical protein QUF72_05055 [Desulfobacterales bacterium HSG2]|nr:hypothetical protein [Desulfobacterales bacterium HSG2]
MSKISSSYSHLQLKFQELFEEYFEPVFSPPSEDDVRPPCNNGIAKKSDHKGITVSRSPADATDARVSDEEEKMRQEGREVRDFLSTECGCRHNCSSQFTAEEVASARADYKSMSWHEQNISLLGELRTMQRNKRTSAVEGSHNKRRKTRERQRWDYYIGAERPVCRRMFLFFHNEGLRRLLRLRKYLRDVGTAPPVHGNVARKPGHACSSEDKNNVTTFIVNYAAVHGLPDPGRDLRTGQGNLKIFLPSVLTYESVHRIYEKSMCSLGLRGLSYDGFRNLWHRSAPHIVFINPRSDLCATCENHRKVLHRAATMSEEEKLRCLREARRHLLEAKAERDYYRKSIRISKKAYSDLNENRHYVPHVPHSCNSADIIMHYSWDYAQDIHFPYEDQQVGTIYFKTPRKAKLFGVCAEGIPKQVNYLTDEDQQIGKGANAVISMLDHFFAVHGVGETHARLTADNCVGQNKNNAILHYLLFRTLTGRHRHIRLSFMLAGHTKFGPDSYFGLIKLRYRRSEVYTYRQLADLISNSTLGGYNICQTYENEPGVRNFEWRSWSEWLSQYFHNLPMITTCQHFSFDHEQPGLVVAKDSVNGDEKTFQLLKKPNFRFGMRSIPYPEIIEPKGLSAERSWYLYDNIREHIPTEYQDETCPLPSISRPKKS